MGNSPAFCTQPLERATFGRPGQKRRGLTFFLAVCCFSAATLAAASAADPAAPLTAAAAAELSLNANRP
jgi:hypothetical protein